MELGAPELKYIAMRKFVCQPIKAAGEGFLTPGTGHEPPLPHAFLWGGHILAIQAVVRSWRSTKRDRGDTYLKRHWFELETACDRRIEVYYDRDARRGASHWWLYTISES